MEVLDTSNDTWSTCESMDIPPEVLEAMNELSTSQPELYEHATWVLGWNLTREAVKQHLETLGPTPRDAHGLSLQPRLKQCLLD